MRKQWLWYSVFLIPVLLIAQTQINWNTQVKNKPSLWNDPGSGTFLKRTGAFTWAAAVAGTDYLNDPGTNGLVKRTGVMTLAQAIAGTDYVNDPGSNGIVKRTGVNTLAPAIPGTDLWNDPGSGTIMKRTGVYTFAAGVDGTDYLSGTHALNFSQTPLTTKGDLWCTDGASNQRLAGASTTNWILAFDSSQTCGLKWVYQPGLINSYAYNSTAQTISASPTTLTFDTNQYDNGGVHNTGVNPTRFTAPSTGTYFIHGQYTQANLSGTYRLLEILKNGTTVLAVNMLNASAFGAVAPQQSLQVSTFAPLTATDYVEFVLKTDSTGINNTSGIGNTFGTVLRIQ